MNRVWHDVPQNTEAWQALRLGKATASNFGCIMANDGAAFGEPAKKYALQLALELATGRKAEFSFSTDHMERGHEQEPVARMLSTKTLSSSLSQTAASLTAAITEIRLTGELATKA